MSTKRKGKSKAATKRKRANIRGATKTEVANDFAQVEGRTEHWTMRIEPNGAALLSETLLRCYFVIKNHGSHTIKLVAQQGDLMDLPPGAVRATYAYGMVRVENSGEKSVLIEFEFFPICMK